MAQLWGGRFTKETDQLVYNFNASITFDQKFYKQDIEGSIAHVTMLAKQGILTEQERDDIVRTLKEIRDEVESGRLEITSEYEDIHSFVEANLIDRLGDTGKKLHTGRSRNDQVALDMRLYTRDELLHTDDLLKELLETILKIMEANTETIMPGFTHLQKAQPITLAHHMGAYFEMFSRDRSRLADIRRRMNYCPLGSGALAGTTYPLDRAYTAELLEFAGPTLNSMDSVSDRDYLIELLSALSVISMHLSRFCEEIIIWNTNEYRFVEIDDSYSTGSSIMPQKKNPDIAELIRGKSGHPYNMMFGLDETFDGVLYVGYHAPAGNGGNPISHTSTGNSNQILLNGKVMSEFMLNTYTAAMMGVPAVFISGDEGICGLAREMVPGITTAAVKKGVGACTINMSVAAADRLLKEKVKEALSGDLKACRIAMPEQFEYVVNYKDLKKAYQMSFFPGAERVDERTNRVVSRDYKDIVTAHSFMVY